MLRIRRFGSLKPSGSLQLPCCSGSFASVTAAIDMLTVVPLPVPKPQLKTSQVTHCRLGREDLAHPTKPYERLPNVDRY